MFGTSTDPVEQGAKGGAQRVKNERDRLDWLFGDGKDDYAAYAEKQGRLRDGEELTKSEIMWMQNFKDTLNFKIGKKAAVDNKGETAQIQNNLIFLPQKKIDKLTDGKE